MMVWCQFVAVYCLCRQYACDWLSHRHFIVIIRTIEVYGIKLLIFDSYNYNIINSRHKINSMLEKGQLNLNGGK